MPLESPAADPAHRRSRLRATALVVGAVLLFAACGADPSAAITTPSIDTIENAQADTAVGTAPDTVLDTVLDTAAAPPDSEVAADPVQPEGFTTTVVRITDTEGESCEVCVWLADSSEERSRGLMGVNDLDGAAGMLFMFAEPAAYSFYMFQTPTPLSIAWFAADGGFVDSTDMSPCLGVPSADCPRYRPGAPSVMALEVWAGGLDAATGGLGIGPGARIDVVGADCDSP